MPRRGGTPSQSNRRHHRQSEREERGKRGARIDPHGFDAGKLIKGKKRHLLVDTLGLLLHAVVHAADVQARDAARRLLATLFGKFPFLQKLFADSAYQGPIFADGLAEILPYLKTEIIKRSDRVKGFVQLPKRCRTHDCLAQSLPPSRQGLGKSQRQRPRLLEARLHPPHAAKALQSLTKFWVGLLAARTPPAFGAFGDISIVAVVITSEMAMINTSTD